MIEIKDLVKKFGKTKVLDNISFTVSKGEIFGFLGPNGAGKTTTMKIITSFWNASSGSISIDGLDVNNDSIKTRKKIGYLPEQVPLYEDMLVYEYLKFIAEVRGIDKEDIKKRIKEVVEECGLKEVIKRPIDEISKGYRQRVGLAQAIMHDPEVLILDEPMTGLDPNQIVEIRDLIKKIGKEKTIIFSSHVLSEVKEIANRILIINKGRIVGEGTPEELNKRAGGKELFYIKIKGCKEDVIEKIKTIKRVESVEVKGNDSEKVYDYEVVPKEGGDIREHLSRTVASAGFAILEYSKKESNLEDTFRELTK